MDVLIKVLLFLSFFLTLQYIKLVFHLMFYHHKYEKQLETRLKKYNFVKNLIIKAN